MDAAVQAVLVGADPAQAARAIIPSILIPRQTLERHVEEEKGRGAKLENGGKGGG